uniref:Uncharacterized protein n=1 Tax=Timema cristinae TaxID=61476 RepID=A0A7R9H333_TIMCR|nr:unnamed protein product [Timema cristinae]
MEEPPHKPPGAHFIRVHDTEQPPGLRGPKALIQGLKDYSRAMSIVCEAKQDIISYFKQAAKQTLLYSQFVSAASCHDGAGPEPHGARVGPSLPLASPPAQLTTPQAWTPAIGTVGTGLLPLTRYVYEVIGLQGPSTAVHEVSSDKVYKVRRLLCMKSLLTRYVWEVIG